MKMELIFMQFLCTWQYGSFYTPQRVDTSKALHSATLPWAECKTSLQKRMVVLVCLPKALDNQPRSVSHPQHPMARCRRYPEFRRKRKNRVYESNIYKYNIYIYIHMLTPPRSTFCILLSAQSSARKLFVQLKIKTEKLKKLEKKRK